MIHVGQSEFDQAEIENVLDALSHNWVTMGRYVERFERAFADFVGTKHAIAVSNGTAALHLALVALGIGEGDEVIVPATTFIATANAVTYTGATPVIVDVDPKTWDIDIGAIENAITPRTKAIIPVHLYGVPCVMDAIMGVAWRNGLVVVEDCAEAIGTRYKNKHVGTFGTFGTFSFYGNKTITTGEGGMIVTDNGSLAEKLRLYRGQGQSNRRYWHEVVGFNYRMTDLQGALGVGQMAKLKRFLQARHSLMQVYLDNLPTPDGLTVQQLNGHDIHGCWAMAVLFNSVSDRVRIQNQLTIEGIETRPIFYPLNEMPPYRDGNLNAVAMKLSAQGLVLPLHTGMTANDVKRICELISEVIHVHRQTA